MSGAESATHHCRAGVRDVPRVCVSAVASVGNGLGGGGGGGGGAVTLHSEDLAYAFGAPLVDGLAPFSSSGFSRADRVFSELVLRYWTNFVKTGSVTVLHTDCLY